MLQNHPPQAKVPLHVRFRSPSFLLRPGRGTLLSFILFFSPGRGVLFSSWAGLDGLCDVRTRGPHRVVIYTYDIVIVFRYPGLHSNLPGSFPIRGLLLPSLL